MNQELVDAARGYIAQGIAVIPVQGKIPIVKTWTEFQKRLPNEQDLLGWSTLSPTGLAAVTGEVSGICVLDVDDLDVLSKYDFPNTVSVETGRGIHFYFEYPLCHYIKSQSGIFPGVDVKGMGGLVTLPPSTHLATGKTYKWQVPFSRDRLAPLPRWLIDQCLAQPASVRITREIFLKGGVQIRRRVGNPLSPDYVSRGMIDKASLVLIEDIVGESTHLSHSGYGRQVGLCPFHEEDTPSFTIYEQTNSFYCFGCSTGGDVIKLTQLLDKFTFPQAVRKLYKHYSANQ